MMAPELHSQEASDTAPAADSPPGAPRRSLRDRLVRLPFFRTRRRTILTALVCVPLLFCLGYWLIGLIALSDSASMVEIKGLVQTRQEEEGAWIPAHLNQLLGRKHRVRTGADSSTRLLFFDVSTVDLQENTEVSIVQVAKRRGGSAVDVVLKTWVGRTAVRAVRFVDPSSSFRIDTPTASTVVRGARFVVQVEEDGTTEIELEEGSAEVQLKEETVPLTMGERITLAPSGEYKTERMFEPDAEAVIAKCDAAWTSPGDLYRLELTETEVNHFLAALSREPDFFLRDTQVWFLEDKGRIATTVVKPTHFDLSAEVSVEVAGGRIEPDIRSVAAGIRLPLPSTLLNLAMDAVMAQMKDYLDQAYTFVEFDEIQVHDRQLLVLGHKQPGAPGRP
jgi:hypothetical protein